MEQLTLTPEDSEKAGLPSHEQQVKNIDLAAEAKKWNKPIIDASGKYISEQDICLNYRTCRINPPNVLVGDALFVR